MRFTFVSVHNDRQERLSDAEERPGGVSSASGPAKRKDCPAGRAGAAMKLQNARALSRCRSRGREFDSPSFRNQPQRCAESGSYTIAKHSHSISILLRP